MTWKQWTVVFISTNFILLGLYDTLAISGGGSESSISHTMIIWSYKYPVFTFIMGFIMGHLFWRLRDTIATKEISEATKKDAS
jgi:hypothetical protein